MWVISIRIHRAQIKVIIDESSLKTVCDFSAFVTCPVVEGMGITKRALSSRPGLVEDITNRSWHFVLPRPRAMTVLSALNK